MGENQFSLCLKASGRGVEYEIETDEPVSMAVIRIVSALEDRDPETLPPLSTVLDPDALDELFAHTDDGTPRIGGHVSFVYSECDINIDHGEYLTAEPLTSLKVRGKGPGPSESGNSQGPAGGV